MSESSKGTPRERESAPTPDRKSELEHVTVDRDGVTLCTMFPRELAERSVSTRWITAAADAFVSRDERR